MGALALGAITAGAMVAGSIADGIAAGEKEDAANRGYKEAFNAAHAGNEAAKRAEQKALPSPNELRALEGTLRAQEITIAREQKLIEAVDPALMEAGKQAFQMLQGKETEMLGPVRRNRERQKQQMKETLRRQLGPGFETSSAGIEAMSRFDMETSDIMAQTQQNAVNSMLGIAGNASAVAKQTEAGAQGRMIQTGQMFGQIQQRQVDAASNTGRQFIAGGNLIGAANGQQVAAAGGVASAVGDGFGQVAKFAGFAATGGLSPETAAAAAPSGGNTYKGFGLGKNGNYGIYD